MAADTSRHKQLLRLVCDVLIGADEEPGAVPGHDHHVGVPLRRYSMRRWRRTHISASRPSPPQPLSACLCVGRFGLIFFSFHCPRVGGSQYTGDALLYRRSPGRRRGARPAGGCGAKSKLVGRGKPNGVGHKNAAAAAAGWGGGKPPWPVDRPTKGEGEGGVKKGVRAR